MTDEAVTHIAGACAQARDGNHQQAEAIRREALTRLAGTTRRERQHVEILSALLQGKTSHALGLAFEHLEEFSIDPLVVQMLSSAVADRDDPALSVEFGMFLRRVTEKSEGGAQRARKEGR
jgi:hypothetical protein